MALKFKKKIPFAVCAGRIYHRLYSTPASAGSVSRRASLLWVRDALVSLSSSLLLPHLESPRPPPPPPFPATPAPRRLRRADVTRPRQGRPTLCPGSGIWGAACGVLSLNPERISALPGSQRPRGEAGGRTGREHPAPMRPAREAAGSRLWEVGGRRPGNTPRHRSRCRGLGNRFVSSGGADPCPGALAGVARAAAQCPFWTAGGCLGLAEPRGKAATPGRCPPTAWVLRWAALGAAWRARWWGRSGNGRACLDFRCRGCGVLPEVRGK